MVNRLLLSFFFFFFLFDKNATEVYRVTLCARLCDYAESQEDPLSMQFVVTTVIRGVIEHCNVARAGPGLFQRRRHDGGRVPS